MNFNFLPDGLDNIFGMAMSDADSDREDPSKNDAHSSDDEDEVRFLISFEFDYCEIFSEK